MPIVFEYGYRSAMKKPVPRSGASAADDRAARLAEALRTNLRRRKAQARAAGERDAQGDAQDGTQGDKPDQ
ncbi:hypothetical protein [Rhizorhabdus argentea]|uniref:hypothetical protein n=1 Tax=Rhizorhabdus argentea TaxID=1387174 RepID=UPI0030EF09F6